MHDVPYGRTLWLGGLLLLSVVLVYVVPWWKARRKRDATMPTDDLGTDDPARPGT